MTLRVLKGLAAGLVLAAGLGGPALAQKTQLTVYTALENDQLKPFKDAIEKAVPGVEVQWVRDSTGVITARFLAEKDAPKADIVLGLAASSLLLFKKAGLLEAYQSPGAAALKPSFRSTDGAWTGQDAFLGVVCYNTIEGQKAGTTVPKSWQDLLDTKYKGKLVMPHPASSGTGFLTVWSWIQLMGEKAAWEYMDKLHENMGVYTHSGSAPCVMAAKGERVAGISLDMRGAKEKTAGAPLEVVVPKEGIGWDMEALAIVKGTKHAVLARKVVDWAVSKEANELYSKYYAVVAHPQVKNLPKNYPATAEALMAKIDFDAMAANRERILKEWDKRYGSKAQPKKK